MIVKAEIRGGRILAVVPWAGGRGRDIAKSIPGHQPLWDKSDPAKDRFIGWTYPLAWSTCVALRKAFEDGLQIGPELAAWAWDERRRAEQLESLRDGDGADLPMVRLRAPKLWEALQARPFQIAGAAFIVQGRQVCLGDEPRLGKTFQAIAAVVESGARNILIACPKTAVRTVWQRKIEELVGDASFVAQEDRSNRIDVLADYAVTTSQSAPEARNWLIVNKEMIRVRKLHRCMVNEAGKPTKFRLSSQPRNRFRPGSKNGCQESHEHATDHEPQFPQLFGMKWDAIILDECHHALASEKNKQSDNISQIRLGAVKLPTHKDTLKIALSGTPFRAKLTKSWGVLNWLRPDVFTSYWQFAERHFGVDTGRWSKVVGDKLKDQAAFDAELRPYYLARTKAQVAPQLPPVQYVDTYLDMTGRQNQAYVKMAQDAKADIEGGTLLANGVLAELVRLKQFACSYGKLSADGSFEPTPVSDKLDWILQFLEEREASTGKVVIASQFTKLVNMFADELRGKGHKVLTLTGESSSRQRDHAQDEFQQCSTRIIIINMFAGGETIDLSAADEMVFLDEPWTDDARQQAEHRIQNLSKQNQLTIYRLRSEGTVEDWIASLNDEQRATLLAAKPQSLKMLQQALG